MLMYDASLHHADADVHKGLSMIEMLKQLLTSQYEASLCTLGHCIARCPDGLLNARVARYPFSQVVFHTLFYADHYLGADAESFRQQAFHVSNVDFFGDYEQLEDREPVCVYERPQIKAYLDFCRDKAVTTIARETADDLSAPARFPPKKFSRAELHVYNIRHIQHHAAQLILRLRLDTDINIPWIGAGWRDMG